MLSSKFKALTTGRGADYVFRHRGQREAMHQGMALLRKAGTLVLVGMPASGVKLMKLKPSILPATASI